MKKILQITLAALLISVSQVLFAQPPPPPPDPEGPTTDPYPPGWVGKSPVGDGYLVLIALGLAYSLKKYFDHKKNEKANA